MHRPPKSNTQWLHRAGALVPQNLAHPAQVALRTYSLCLFLSLGPSLVPFAISRSKKYSTSALKRVLARELGLTGFAFSITLAVGGGSLIRDLWRRLDDLLDSEPDSRAAAAARVKLWSAALSSAHKTFLSHVISSTVGLLLLQAGRRNRQTRSDHEPSASHTLDLTLLLFVRALDAAVQSFVARSSGSRRESDAGLPLHRKMTVSQRKRELLRSQIDSLLFWACSARIMWCFFYEPQRLPTSYVKWINTLARLDTRVIEALRAIRAKDWSYQYPTPPSHQKLLTTYAQELGHPAAWGDPSVLPAYGGAHADKIWKSLGVTSRQGVGGLPCQVVHGKVGSGMGLEHSCTANAGLRGSRVLLEAMAIYLPVQFVPILLSHPGSLLNPVRVLEALVGALRSASFLSVFVTSYWYSVCFTRSLVLAPLFGARISHDFWDGPYGGVLVGSLVCGSSIWIENSRRRGEMALYVLPRAVRSLLPDSWLKSGRWGAVLAERIAFVISLSALLTAANHHPHVLRGLSRWGIRYVARGPDAVFWRKPDPTREDEDTHINP